MKNRKILSIVAIVLVVAVMIGMMTMFAAASDDSPVVVYNHAARRFEFRNTEPYTVGKADRKYPDLFKDFKGMMPGDSMTQSITVRAENLGGGYAYISLRTEYDNGDLTTNGVDEEIEDYQKLVTSPYVTLVVTCDGVVLDTGSLEQGVVLGKFMSGDEVELEVTLSIDILAGNELAGLQAGIGWVFITEYYGADPGPGVDPIVPPGGGERDHYAYIIGMPDGLVHPEALMTRAEVATVFFRMMTEEMREKYWSKVNSYYDVFPDDWYNNAISTLTNAGIVNGRPGNVFEPLANITRAEVAAMAVRFFGDTDVEVGEEDAFPDIADSWANYEINLAYALDLVEGLPDGTFRPDQLITRAEAITIINRVLEREPHKDYLLNDMIKWPDNMDTTKWYYADVQEATNSHTYFRRVDRFTGERYEVWQTMLPVRDWAALERMWSELYSAPNPGEVVSSRINAVYD